MKKLLSSIVPIAVLLCATLPVGAQPKAPPASPRDKVTASVGGQTITVDYSRPYMKGRKIFGGLVPFGQVWRTGANDATTFTTTGDLMLGSLHVPAGTYALFTIPGETEWTIILNKVAKTWGSFSYEKNKAEDLGQVKVKAAEAGAPVEQLTINVTPQGGDKQALLTISWDKTVVKVPISVH
jgi:hypothetical protein